MKNPAQTHSLIICQWMMCNIWINNLVAMALTSTNTNVEWICCSWAIWDTTSTAYEISTKNRCLGLLNNMAARSDPFMLILLWIVFLHLVKQYQKCSSLPVSVNRVLFLTMSQVHLTGFLLHLKVLAVSWVRPVMSTLNSLHRPLSNQSSSSWVVKTTEILQKLSNPSSENHQTLHMVVPQ